MHMFNCFKWWTWLLIIGHNIAIGFISISLPILKMNGGRTIVQITQTRAHDDIDVIVGGKPRNVSCVSVGSLMLLRFVLFYYLFIFSNGILKFDTKPYLSLSRTIKKSPLTPFPPLDWKSASYSGYSVR
jgi:hypothetical protein